MNTTKNVQNLIQTLLLLDWNMNNINPTERHNSSPQNFKLSMNAMQVAGIEVSPVPLATASVPATVVATRLVFFTV